MSVKIDYERAIRDVDENKNPLDLDTIYITAGGYIRYPFRGISTDSVWGINETVWGGDLTRSRTTFALQNIDDVDFGIVPRCEISFKYLNVQDYLVLCKMAQQRTMTVDFFNRDLGRRQTLEMAMTNQERGNLYHYGAEEYIGNFNIKIKLVATNREIAGSKDTKFSVVYDDNGGSGTLPANASGVPWSHEYTIGTPNNLKKSGKNFTHWNTNADGSGESYLPGQGLTIWKNYHLFAIYAE